MDKELAQKVFSEITRKRPLASINVSRLARELHIPQSSLNQHMHANRRWRIESWLGTIFKLGAVEVGKDGVFIRSRELVKALKRI